MSRAIVIAESDILDTAAQCYRASRAASAQWDAARENVLAYCPQGGQASDGSRVDVSTCAGRAGSIDEDVHRVRVEAIRDTLRALARAETRATPNQLERIAGDVADLIALPRKARGASYQSVSVKLSNQE